MPIALGCAWFPGVEEHPAIVDSVDFIEVAGWSVSETFDRPHHRLVLHNLDKDWSMAAVDAIDRQWPERLRAAILATRTPWFSMHLGFSAESVRFDGHMLPESEPLDRDELLARIVGVTNEARFECPLQVLLENLDYCPEGAYEHVCDPDFIAEVIEMTGAGLLFDLAHWQVSASWLGYDPVEELATLPLDRVVEVHLSSPRPTATDPARLDDAHEQLLGPDLDLLNHVLRLTSPRAITIEYRRDPAELVNQIDSVQRAIS